MLEKFTKNRKLVLFAGVVLILVVELSDLFTGPELTFSVFYLSIILYFSYFFGLKAGLLVSVLSAALSVGTDLVTDLPYSHISIPIWTFMIRLSNFWIVAFIFSLLEKKRKEMAVLNKELHSVNESLNFFTSMASHDLKTPVAVIKMYASFLKEPGSGLNEEGLKHVETIERTSKAMMKLIQDLLEYAKASQKNLSIEEVDLNEMLRRLEIELAGVIREKNAVLKINELPVIEANPVLIHQLFQNLLTNALKYCEKRPEIQIDSIVSQDNVTLHIADNGIGFEDSHLQDVFAPFKRLHSDYEGTGMGLAICKKIVEQHRGTITASSRLNQGSTFHISLPLKQPRDSQGAASSFSQQLPALKENTVISGSSHKTLARSGVAVRKSR